MSDSNCIFCKIINHEIPSDIIYEDGDTIAIVDIRPVSKGHTLVMPKKHSQDFLSTSEEELTKTTHTLKKVAAAVLKATGAAGLNISTNNGVAAGQTVHHLHYHIIPRSQSDGLSPWPHQESEPKSRSEIADAIKKQL